MKKPPPQKKRKRCAYKCLYKHVIPEVCLCGAWIMPFLFPFQLIFFIAQNYF